MHSTSARLALDPSRKSVVDRGSPALVSQIWAASAARWVSGLAAAMTLLLPHAVVAQGPQPPDCIPPAVPITGGALGPSANTPSGIPAVDGPKTGGGGSSGNSCHDHSSDGTLSGRHATVDRVVDQSESTVTADGHVRIRIGPVTWTTETTQKWPNAVSGILDVPGPPYGNPLPPFTLPLPLPYWDCLP